ncbi:MAG: hypothetical protein UU10_C0002G0008 [Parcubacteria group bacterium GW2011_GWF1_40_6]|uniref:Uncharacterized protein n=2 Tax=Candidatus Nomuraibacteriota TaxID=1752729 RepID=A0A0G0QTR3_9BACT|nr:MAG: hypothetical protein UT78_C0001G0035 [Candidatus Nomurabacteria bacterium GW2011_GWF2_40_12]KKR69922.1 MAG: hypothetical protein UU10_C0002G0008 [Parcubacteria group bacterium GW2011_GWF1_40_6]OGJ09523.1 MAG: hypothetical protein A2356_03145 [Candidatus Nomurabacteria bacterium RIFOXYB1_FULL_39_16]OGJ15428.1 MAG: hypothetical protein A2585_00315 [Candidatus Nomurabacteria bacterium RIFOXYD1_FULL_39_12]
MENEQLEEKIIKKDSPYATPIAIVIVGIMLSSAVFFGLRNPSKETPLQKAQSQVSALEEAVLPSKGVVLPASWGNLGVQLVDSGAIDADKFKAIYEQRGAFTDEYKNLLLGDNNGKIKITRENSGYYLNLFWALGLANKNSILDTGEMVDPKYGGAGNFASTGGWTIAKGKPMDHYSKHAFITLTLEQQALVDKVSRGIYRPCCGNSVHFPDCNHGMAMLGLLELMASQGASEQDMWKTALVVNSYWFPDTYLTIATYMKDKGIEWKNVNPQEMLGANYSSGQGFANIAAQVTKPASSQSAGGCGVDTGGAHANDSAPAPKQQSGCGI